MQPVLRRRKRKNGTVNRSSVKTTTLKILMLSVIFALQSFLLPACGTEEPQSVPKVKAVKKKKTVTEKKEEKQEAVEQKEEKTVYFYDSTGKPDPFVPLITEIEPPSRKRPEQKKINVPLTPLQKYDLDELKLVAIVKSGDQLSALFEDMSEFGYIVNENTLIGKNGGVIKKITYDKVIVEESLYNSAGEIEKSIRSLKIQHNE